MHTTQCLRKEKCQTHGKPIAKQLDPVRRFRCLEALLAIKDLPSCYNTVEFRAFCQAELGRVANDIIDAQSDDSSDSSTSSTSGLARILSSPTVRPATPCATGHRRGTVPSTPSSVRYAPSTPRKSASQALTLTPSSGRKPLPRAWINFYIYHKDYVFPLSIDIEAIVDPDGVCRVRFNDPQIC